MWRLVQRHRPAVRAPVQRALVPIQLVRNARHGTAETSSLTQRGQTALDVPRTPVGQAWTARELIPSCGVAMTAMLEGQTSTRDVVSTSAGAMLETARRHSQLKRLCSVGRGASALRTLLHSL